MFVPKPVISLAIHPKKENPNFSRALNRFQREDPTFKVHMDESKQTIISGMGELHLDIYVERMKREYNVDCTVGKPRYSYANYLVSLIAKPSRPGLHLTTRTKSNLGDLVNMVASKDL